jgi:hypothetical protein
LRNYFLKTEAITEKLSEVHSVLQNMVRLSGVAHASFSPVMGPYAPITRIDMGAIQFGQKWASSPSD